MSISEMMDDPYRAWAPYEPSPRVPWDLARVAHLHRRAGFAASWEVLQRDCSEGPEATLQRILDGEPQALDGQPAETFEVGAHRMAIAMGSGGNLSSLQAAWLYRMIHTPHPLKERMTLFWHDHFATSNAKVNNPGLMRRQNDLLREHALGDFKALLRSMARDPAMLIWLDSVQNRKARPNENYAREVMELFTLGRGRYTEADIQEAARAFTGSFVRGEVHVEVADQHDAGDKTILGHTGRFTGEDVATILLEQPACATYLCRKLFQSFVSDVTEPSESLLAPLAAQLREADYNLRAPIETILRSQLFHESSTRRQRVKSPVELTVGTLRALEIVRPTVSIGELVTSLDQMGQSLFSPPSVAGWDWGSSWINSTTILARTNFALALVGTSGGLGNRLDPDALARRHGHASNPDQFFLNLLLQDGLEDRVRGTIRGNAREVATLILTAPEYQLA